jgi:hypothetical protein
MVALIFVLSSLRILWLQYRSPQSRPDWESRSLPPLKCSVLPALYELHFRDVTEYLEKLVTHIDIPQISKMDICLFNQIDFDCPRLTHNSSIVHPDPRNARYSTRVIQ